MPGVAQPLAAFRKRAALLTAQHGTWRLLASTVPGGSQPFGGSSVPPLGTRLDGAEPQDAPCAWREPVVRDGWLLPASCFSPAEGCRRAQKPGGKGMELLRAVPVPTRK